MIVACLKQGNVRNVASERVLSIAMHCRLSQLFVHANLVRSTMRDGGGGGGMVCREGSGAEMTQGGVPV